MIRVFNSATAGERWISLEDVTIVTQGICTVFGSPYIFFEHKDYPLGALRAEYKDNHWSCDLD